VPAAADQKEHGHSEIEKPESAEQTTEPESLVPGERQREEQQQHATARRRSEWRRIGELVVPRHGDTSEEKTAGTSDFSHKRTPERPPAREEKSARSNAPPPRRSV
jgi:hypothetical protein